MLIILKKVLKNLNRLSKYNPFILKGIKIMIIAFVFMYIYNIEYNN